MVTVSARRVLTWAFLGILGVFALRLAWDAAGRRFSISDLGREQTFELTSRWKANTALEVLVTGEVEGAGRVAVSEAEGAVLGEVPVGPGPVDARIAGDFYAKTATLRYVPMGATGGKLRVVYAFDSLDGLQWTGSLGLLLAWALVGAGLLAAWKKFRR